jgi:predicted AlkP superfamily phosphohydrolase/phosphomutase
MKRRVVIIGLDGATWDIINTNLDKLPNLEKIVKNGTHGILMSTYPCLTGPAWTSAFTGVNPGKHGILDFLKYDGFTRIPVTSNDIDYPCIWDTLSQRKMKSLAIAIPLGYPAKEINGVMITGFGSRGEDEYFTYPSDLKNEILSHFPSYSIEPKHSFTSDPKEYKKEILEIADQNSELTKLMVEKNPDWDLLVTVFSSPDWMQHFYWGQDSIFKVYKKIDDFIGWAMENLLDGQTHLMLMSDHGFEKIDKMLYLNRYMEEKGYLKTKEDTAKSIAAKFDLRTTLRNLDFLKLRRFIPFTVKDQLPLDENDTVVYDFENSTAWLRSSSGNGIYVKDKSLVGKIKEELILLKDPQTRKNIFREVLESKDIYWGPYSSDAPDLILDPNPGYCIMENYNKKWIAKTTKNDLSGAHNMKGMYAVYGPDITSNQINMVVWDIAAMALHLMGLPLFDDMDGKVREEIFDANSSIDKRPKYIKNIKNIAKRWKHGKKTN